MSFIEAINDIQILTDEYQKVKNSGQNLESFIDQAELPKINYSICGHQNMTEMNDYTPFDNFYDGVECATVSEYQNPHNIVHQFDFDEDFDLVSKTYEDGSRCFYSGTAFSYINTAGKMACMHDNGNIALCDFDPGIVGNNVNNIQTKLYISMKEF